MMRSMFSGVSGMRVHQTKMDVIANNISNVNTSGYKSSRVTFSEIFSQTVQGASGANTVTGRGGTNPLQIGLGSNVASIDMIMTNGAAQRTDNPYDLMIQGNGFFIVSDVSGTYFTRAGAFRLDQSGFLVDPNGMVLNGWKAFEGTIPGTRDIPKTNTQGIQISADDEYIKPNATSFVKFSGNLNAVTDTTKETSISFFDSLGNKYTIKTQLKYDENTKAWGVVLADRAFINDDTQNFVTFTAAALTGAVNSVSGNNPAGVTLTFTGNSSNTPAGTINFTNNTGASIIFNQNGMLDIPAPGGGTGSVTSLQLGIAPGTVLNPDARFEPLITCNFEGLTQFNAAADATTATIDGNKSGTLNGVSIGKDGKITGTYSNGQTKVLWQVAIAKFKNPAGLERVGNNLYLTSPNSGDFDGVGEEASGGTNLMAGVLEMSNVDLAQEFTEMITTQRGFQANSRVITTSDDMLLELVNLKR